MPEMNGKKLADEARRRRPYPKILFTTGYTPTPWCMACSTPGEPPRQALPLVQLATKVRAVLDQ